MAVNLKRYLYSKGRDAALDTEFAEATRYGKVKSGKQTIFWTAALRWYAMPVTNLQRIYRRVEPVYGRLCCGGRSYFMEYLVLVQQDGEELVVHIGDDMEKKAKALLARLQEIHPNLEFGKVYDVDVSGNDEKKAAADQGGSHCPAEEGAPGCSVCTG